MAIRSDAFAYLSVMVSILLGMGLSTLFGGIGNLVQIRRRVKRYWLHTLWVGLLIAIHLHMWWSFWALRGVTNWTYAMFVYVLLGPAAVVIASHIAIPELLNGRIDVEKHYFDTGHIFFSLLCAAAVWAMLLEPVMRLRPFFIPFRLVQAVGVITLGCAAWSRNRRLHAVAVVIVATLLITVVTLTRYEIAQLDYRR